MLYVFCFHQILPNIPLQRTRYPIEAFLRLLDELFPKYPSVLPGDPLSLFSPSISLTFDDASFDFYHYVFPLLKQRNLKALLSIPTFYIKEKSNSTIEERLSGNLFDENSPHTPFCTWEEIRTMVETGLIEAASHSHTHIDLTKEVDLNLEILSSKALLEEKLKRKIKTFVFPFGKFNGKTLQLAKKHYPYVMRVGSSFNLSWQNLSGVIYRLPSDLIKKGRPKNWAAFLTHSIRGR